MEAYEKLEHEFGEFQECDHMVACSSGSAALHLALETLKVIEGWKPYESRVTIPDFTMIACPRAVTMAGMVNEFADVDNLGLLSVDTRLCIYNKAVMQVHLYGRKCSWSDARRTDDQETIVINDTAEAHGLKHRPSEIACWSFYKNKVIAGEEGGMVALTNKHQVKIAKSLRSMGFTDDHDFGTCLEAGTID